MVADVDGLVAAFCWCFVPPVWVDFYAFEVGASADGFGSWCEVWWVLVVTVLCHAFPLVRDGKFYLVGGAVAFVSSPVDDLCVIDPDV